MSKPVVWVLGTGGTIASKKRGRRKCIVPVNPKKAATAARESLIEGPAYAPAMF